MPVLLIGCVLALTTSFMVGFAGVCLVDIFLKRAIAHEGMVIKFRGIFGLGGVEMVFVF